MCCHFPDVCMCGCSMHGSVTASHNMATRRFSRSVFGGFLLLFLLLYQFIHVQFYLLCFRVCLKVNSVVTNLNTVSKREKRRKRPILSMVTTINTVNRMGQSIEGSPLVDKQFVHLDKFFFFFLYSMLNKV